MRPGPRSRPSPARPPAPGARTRPRSAAPAPRRSRPARSSRLSNARHGSVHSSPPTQRDGPGCLRHGAGSYGCRTHGQLASAHSPGRAYPPVAFRPSHRRDGGEMTVKRVGIVGSGIMGSGIAEVAAKAGFEVVLRSRAQAPPTRWSPGSRSRWPSRSIGASSKPTSATRCSAGSRAVTDLGELADCDLVHRVDRRRPRRQEAPLHRARPHLPRAHDPRDQHVDAAGRRDGDEHRPARQGVRHPLLQPRADDGARRGRARDHVERRDDRRRPPRSPRRAARTRCR